MRSVQFFDLPPVARTDALRAIDRVPPESQTLLIQAAAEAELAELLAIERLCCLTACAAAVNLTDDLADGDCHYLEAKTAPGVSFLLQAFAGGLAVRGGVSAVGLREFWLRLSKAAGGQSIEVRTDAWNEATYRDVAALIAGEQYAAYLRLLWDGTPLEHFAFELGHAMGTVTLVHSDVESGDRRFFSLPVPQQMAVLDDCLALLGQLESGPSRAVRNFALEARAVLHAERARQR